MNYLKSLLDLIKSKIDISGNEIVELSLRDIATAWNKNLPEKPVDNKSKISFGVQIDAPYSQTHLRFLDDVNNALEKLRKDGAIVLRKIKHDEDVLSVVKKPKINKEATYILTGTPSMSLEETILIELKKDPTRYLRKLEKEGKEEQKKEPVQDDREKINSIILVKNWRGSTMRWGFVINERYGEIKSFRKSKREWTLEFIKLVKNRGKDIKNIEEAANISSYMSEYLNYNKGCTLYHKEKYRLTTIITPPNSDGELLRRSSIKRWMSLGRSRVEYNSKLARIWNLTKTSI